MLCWQRMKKLLKRIAQSIPGLDQFVFIKGTLRGHFYSPVPSLKEIRLHRQEIFNTRVSEIPGIHLHEREQLQLVERFAFTLARKVAGLRSLAPAKQ